jgi:hypothetical protein
VNDKSHTAATPVDHKTFTLLYNVFHLLPPVGDTTVERVGLPPNHNTMLYNKNRFFSKNSGFSSKMFLILNFRVQGLGFRV